MLRRVEDLTLSLEEAADLNSNQVSTKSNVFIKSMRLHYWLKSCL